MPHHAMLLDHHTQSTQLDSNSNSSSTESNRIPTEPRMPQLHIQASRPSHLYRQKKERDREIENSQITLKPHPSKRVCLYRPLPPQDQSIPASTATKNFSTKPPLFIKTQAPAELYMREQYRIEPVQKTPSLCRVGKG